MGSIVVIGASGFIGKHLVQHLLDEKKLVTAVVRDSDKLGVLAENHALNIVQCEMKNHENLAQMIDQEVDAVVYLAWQGNSGAARADYDIQTANFKGIFGAIEFAAKANAKRFIATGTISERLLELECAQITSQNMMYAAAKLGVSKMAAVLCQKYEMQFTWLRLGNVYGEGNTTGNLMDYTVEMLQKAQRPTYSAALVLQDFVYVGDCVQAIAIACEVALKQNTYYIGTGEPRQLKEFLFIARDAINPALEMGIGERPDDGTHYEREWFSIDAFALEVGYKPLYSFEEGIKRTIGYNK